MHRAHPRTHRQQQQTAKTTAYNGEQTSFDCVDVIVMCSLSFFIGFAGANPGNKCSFQGNTSRTNMHSHTNLALTKTSKHAHHRQAEVKSSPSSSVSRSYGLL